MAVINDIGTELRDLVNWTRWGMMVLIETVAESRNEERAMSGLTRDAGQPNLTRKAKISGTNVDKEKSISLVQVTKSRID